MIFVLIETLLIKSNESYKYFLWWLFRLQDVISRQNLVQNYSKLCCLWKVSKFDFLIFHLSSTKNLIHVYQELAAWKVSCLLSHPVYLCIHFDKSSISLGLLTERKVGNRYSSHHQEHSNSNLMNHLNLFDRILLDLMKVIILQKENFLQSI